MDVNPNIFREYDIRGEAERDLPDNVCRQIGRALASHFVGLGKRRIAVCRDCRLSSPRIHAAVTEGLVWGGLELVDIGVGPTPLLYFTVFNESLDGGIQITGSHNEAADNGIKIMIGKKPFFGADIQTICSMVEQDTGNPTPGGRRTTLDPRPAYVASIARDIDLAHTDLRFAFDAGNGAGGPLGLRVFDALGLKPVALLCDMDGAFPVHHPDPTDEANLALLRDTVLEQQLDFGIAFDGDADRIGVVDARGEVVWGDRLMVLYSRAVLRANPGATILGEVKCSQTLFDDIRGHGGHAEICKTGHSLIKTKMAQQGALLAGEMSGHIFFADRHDGFDDATYAAARLIEILAKASAPMHELLSDLPQTHFTPELRHPCADTTKFAVVDAVLARYRDTHDVLDIDGARIQFDGGWGLVRASNTQAVLVMRFEAQTPERLAAIRSEVEQVVQDAQAVL